MRYLAVVSWLVFSMSAAACSSPAKPSPPVKSGTPLARMRPATLEEARALLGRSDAFTQQMSPADRSFRLKQPLPVTEAALLSYEAAQAESFTPAELARLDRARIILEAGLAARGLTLDAVLPSEVLVIKTSSTHEFGAPHTRQNAIIMPGAASELPDEIYPIVVAHELWHVMSRHSASLRQAAYAMIGTAAAPGFTMPSEVAERYATNPDAPDVGYRVPVSVAGKTAWVMALLSFKVPQFTPGTTVNFTELLELRFVELAANASGAWQPVRAPSGALVTHDYATLALAPCYGGNTVNQQSVHPEEVMAHNFSLLAVGDIPSRPKVTTPALLDDLAALLANGGVSTSEPRCRY